jgi:hypothetical protein
MSTLSLKNGSFEKVFSIQMILSSYNFSSGKNSIAITLEQKWTESASCVLAKKHNEIFRFAT